MTPYTEALAILHQHTRHVMPEETVPLVLASGRVLSKPIVAGENIPAAPNSAMDGYAIRAEDVATASPESPVTLAIIGESAAGNIYSGRVEAGQAVRIMTGGMVPEGATGVIEVESTTEASGQVSVQRAIKEGESIRKAGEDVREGTEVIAAGKRIRPGDIGVLASLGVTNVPVRVKPIVGILSTGNEIVEPYKTPPPGQVRNSSSAALYAYCTEAGAEPIDLGIVGDDRDELEERLEEGLRYDILITTGGVSAGSYDYVQHIFPQLGVEVQFHKVNIRPGKPILFGTYDDGNQMTLIFGLPGNPVSSLVTFRQFVAPAIRRLLVATEQPHTFPAILAEPIRKHDDKRHFVRGIVSSATDGTLQVTTTGTQSSGAMSSMSIANALIVLNENDGDLPAGSTVFVELL